MRLAISPAARCNITCRHCSKGCGPHSSEALSLTQAFAAIDEAAMVDDGLPFEVSINGGEPFLNLSRLTAIVQRAQERSALISAVTNAYWATSEERALRILQPLQAAGLGMIGVSAGHYHQQYVGIDCVYRALRAAQQLGMRTVIKCALLAGDRIIGDRPHWLSPEIEADHIELFAVVGPGRPNQVLEEAKLLTEPGLPRGACPSEEIAVGEDAIVYACGSSTRLNGFQALGRLGEQPIGHYLHSISNSTRHQILRRVGPAHFADAIAERGAGAKLRSRYGSVCDLCTHIAHDPVMTSIADEVCREHEAQALRIFLHEARSLINPDSFTQTKD